MSVCPKCGASVSMYDTGGTPWYACGSKGTFRSGSCVDREPVATQLRQAQDRIKQLEEELMEVKNKHSVLVADVVLDEDRADRIKRLENLGKELRECASQIGWTSSEEPRWLKRAEAAESQIAEEALKP